MGFFDKIKEVFNKIKSSNIEEGIVVEVEDLADSSNKEIRKIVDYKKSHENLTPEYERILDVLLLIHTLVDKKNEQKLSILDAANLVAYQRELYLFSKRNSNNVGGFSSFDDDESTIELTADDLKKYVEFSSFDDEGDTYNITDSDLAVFASFEDDDVETVINIGESDLEFFIELNKNGDFAEDCKVGGKELIDKLVFDFSKFKKEQLLEKKSRRNNNEIITDVDDNGYPIPIIDLTSGITKDVSDSVRKVGITDDEFDLDEFTLGLDKDK